MNVRDLTIELRPRSGWEAIDLGHALARQHYRNLLRIGFRGFAIPTFVLAVLCWQAPWLLFVLIWFLKPLLDRFYLFYLSRSIFGQAVSVGETLAQWKRLVFKGSLPVLTLRRFSPFRSMTMPTADLEGLSGGARSRRATVVSQVGGGSAVGNTFGGAWLEIVFLFSVSLLAAMMIPEGQNVEWYQFTSWLEEGEIGPRLLTLALGLSYGVLVLLLEPFYLAGGFALYLNSRTSQESWDVELRFRELANRAANSSPGDEPIRESQTKRKALSGSASLPLALIGALLLTLAGAPFAPAEERNPQEVIARVMEEDEFERHTETYKKRVPNEDGWWEKLQAWLDERSESSSASTGGGGGFAEGLLRLIGIVALAILLGVVGVVIYKILQNRRGPRETLTSRRPKRPAPRVVMGMAVTEESLPDDLLGMAKSHWNAGEPRLALSLLYRGALTHFITQSQVAIESSDTESECARRVREEVEADKSQYFDQLSERWMRVAYSTLEVTPSEFETLCGAWPFQTR